MFLEGVKYGFWHKNRIFWLIMLKNFRAFQLAKEIYQTSKTLKLPAHLKDQLLRASSSIALNLAESSGERTEKEKERYYTIARGSLLETQAILELEGVTNLQLDNSLDQLGAILYKLCQIESKRNKSESKMQITQ